MEQLKITNLEDSRVLNSIWPDMPYTHKYSIYLSPYQSDNQDLIETIPAYTEDELLAFVPKQLMIPTLPFGKATAVWDLKKAFVVVGCNTEEGTYYYFYSRHLYSPVYEARCSSSLDALVGLIKNISKEYDSKGKYKL